MDPDKIYLAMFDAMQSEEYGEARKHALSLKEYFDGGASWPGKHDQFVVEAYLNIVLYRTSDVVILPFQLDWLPAIRDIDIKASDWSWCEERWKDISKYIIRTWWCAKVMKGFSAFQFNPKGYIRILKLEIHPLFKGQWEGEILLFKDIEETANKHGVKELRMTVWEYDDDRIKCPTALGFKALGFYGKFPDGSDGYEFSKGVGNDC